MRIKTDYIGDYQGSLPAQCGICLEEEPSKDLLLQTICCSNVAKKIIPRIYHRVCLKEWASKQSSNLFPCIYRCGKSISKSELFSRIDRTKQLLFSPLAKKLFKQTTTTSITLILGLLPAAILIKDKDLSDFENNTKVVGLASILGLGLSMMTCRLLYKMEKVPLKINEYSLLSAIASIPPTLIYYTSMKVIGLIGRYKLMNMV